MPIEPRVSPIDRIPNWKLRSARHEIAIAIFFSAFISNWQDSHAQQLTSADDSPRTNGTSDLADNESAANILEDIIDQLIYKGEFDEAETRLNSALEGHPDHEGLLVSRNLLEFVTSSSEEILEDARAEQYEQKIDALIFSGNFDTASTELSEALAIFPDHEGLQASASMLEVFRFFSGDDIIRVLGWTLFGLALVPLICFASIIFLLLCRRPLIASTVYIVTVFMIAMPTALFIGLIAFSIEDSQKFGDELSAVGQHVFFLFVSCFLGALGGALNCSFALANQHSHPIPKTGQFAYFFFRPINGFFLAAVMYIALLSGQFVLFEGTNTTPSGWSFALVAVLTGMFSQVAIAKLRQVSSTFF